MNTTKQPRAKGSSTHATHAPRHLNMVLYKQATLLPLLLLLLLLVLLLIVNLYFFPDEFALLQTS